MMNASHETFSTLIEKALEGSITAQEMTRLDRMIIHDAEKRRHYCEYLHMTIGLMRLCDQAPLTGVQKYDDLYFESLWQALVAEERIAPAVAPSTPLQVEIAPPKRVEPVPSVKKSNRLFLGLAAGCLMVPCLILLTAFIRDAFLPQEVATLSTALDARFSHLGSIDPGTRLSNRNERLELESGLVKLDFDGGASVLIEAPARFRLQAPDRLVLSRGQLFAFVPEIAQGFTVATPSSQIVDLGTQFGVRVNGAGASDLHMIEGKASLTSPLGREADRSSILIAGQARQMARDGAVQDIPLQKEAFVRHFDARTKFVWRGQHLSLVDLVGQGDGFGSGQNNLYVNPVMGYTHERYGPHLGNEYHPLDANPVVDGLFVPDGSKRQVVSSLGHEFETCPPTNGESYANLGVNPAQRVFATPLRTGRLFFEGQAYGTRDHPCLVMHANLGVTFDLAAIRQQYADMSVTHFVSMTGVADFDESSGCNADFWILVDGQVRGARQHVTQKGVLQETTVSLGPEDRFLTLVTTDGGDVDHPGEYQRSFTCDWCVFAAPALELEPADRARQRLKRSAAGGRAN